MMLEKAGYTVGSATREGLWADGKLLSRDDSTNPMSARTLLQDVRIDAAIIETPIGVVIEQGLGIDSCDVVVIDPAGENSAEGTSNASIQASVTLANLAQRAVVIDFAHPLRAKLSQGRDADDFILVSTRPNPPDLDEHVSKNGRAIVFDGVANPPAFKLIGGDGPMKRIHCPEFGLDNSDQQIHATAFAIACALAIGISTDVDWQHADDN